MIEIAEKERLEQKVKALQREVNNLRRERRGYYLLNLFIYLFEYYNGKKNRWIETVREFFKMTK